MDEKQIIEEYKRIKAQEAPDLWERIESGLKEHPERDLRPEEAGGIGNEKVEKTDLAKRRRFPGRRTSYGMAAAAAAALALLVAVPKAAELSFQGKSGAMPETAAAVRETLTEKTEAAVMDAAVNDGEVYEEAAEEEYRTASAEAGGEEAPAEAGASPAEEGARTTEAGAAMAKEGARITGAGAAPAEAGARTAEAPGAAAGGSPAAAVAGDAKAPEMAMGAPAYDSGSSQDSAARNSAVNFAVTESFADADAAPPVLTAGEADGMAGKSMSRKYRSAAGISQPAPLDTEEYSYISENGYRTTAAEPLSTFSVDVDTASYGNVRRMLRNGQRIPADAVRIEELINYFSYDYPEPEGEEPFSVTTEYSDCPWNKENRLLMIGLQAEKIDLGDRPASNLVFLLDVSGSMYSDDKLPLVQKAFSMLTENLTEADRISIVTYAGYESVVLDGVSGEEKAAITAALSDLEAGGSTAGAAGIRKAYELARKHFIDGGNNRVILATDGDLNVGITSESELTRLIQKERESGVYLSVLGVGTGNLKDNKMEALADNGNGNYHYLDSIFEAKKVLVDEMGGTLVTVAKDVKIQVEFNPAQVAAYRLIGYENRLLDNEDFHNDKVDAGEIGAGHTVTALYEIIPAGKDTEGPDQTGLRYQTAVPVESSELLTVSLRYKAPDGDQSKLLECPVEADTYRRRPSENLTFAAAVAEFGMVLRDSENKGTSTMESAMALAESCVHAGSDDYRKEFLELIGLAEQYLETVR